MSDLMSEDPAAEFLQQEGDQLRELGIEEDQFNVVDPFADPLAPPVPVSMPAATPAAAPVVTNEVNFIDEFESDIENTPQESLVNGYPDLGMPDGASFSVQQPIHMIIPSVEPESLGKWRDEKAASLRQQERDEQEAATAWAEKAKKELEDWYNRYNEQLDKVQNENRAAQDQFIEEMTDTKPGNEWEKVARFCDFNPKFSKNTKDVSRMRSLLLQLKQNPLVR